MNEESTRIEQAEKQSIRLNQLLKDYESWQKEILEKHKACQNEILENQKACQNEILEGMPNFEAEEEFLRTAKLSDSQRTELFKELLKSKSEQNQIKKEIAAKNTELHQNVAAKNTELHQNVADATTRLCENVNKTEKQREFLVLMGKILDAGGQIAFVVGSLTLKALNDQAQEKRFNYERTMRKLSGDE